MRSSVGVSGIGLLLLFVALGGRRAAAARHDFAIKFTSPEKFARLSSEDVLTLSWSCSMLALDRTAHQSSAAEPPTLVLSILNEVVHTQLLHAKVCLPREPRCHSPRAHSPARCRICRRTPFGLAALL
jgi:hypothetical protein